VGPIPSTYDKEKRQALDAMFSNEAEEKDDDISEVCLRRCERRQRA
jgi:hypothetical protein